MFAARTSLPLVIVLVLATLPCNAQEPPLFDGELGVISVFPVSVTEILVIATGTVWGGLPGRAITHAYDTLRANTSQAAWIWVDRSSNKTPPLVALPRIPGVCAADRAGLSRPWMK